jgi:S1-C subfamily serine protease
MSRSAAFRVVVVLGVALLLLALAGLWVVPRFGAYRTAAAAEPRPIAPRGTLFPSEQATIELFEKTRVSVVHITTQARVVDVWTRNMFNIPRGTGSGFAWDDRGHIVTNNHVVEGASGARATVARSTPRSSASVPRTTWP